MSFVKRGDAQPIVVVNPPSEEDEDKVKQAMDLAKEQVKKTDKNDGNIVNSNQQNN